MPQTCQTCHRSANILKALGKYEVVQGYPQCSICRADLEDESVVLRQIHFERRDKEGAPLPGWLESDLKSKGLLEDVLAVTGSLLSDEEFDRLDAMPV